MGLRASRIAVVAVATAVLAAGCRRAARGDAVAALRLTDDVGRTVAVRAPARRIVSLAPATTELLFALGAGDAVVGRTPWCRYPPAALAVPVVGDGLAPNVEAIAARRPDLVLVYRSGANDAAVAQLAGLGIPALVLQKDRLGDLARDARLLGRATGHGGAGDSIGAALAALAARPRPAPRTRVAFVAWDNPPIVIGGGSYLDELAGLAGAANVFHDLPAASAPVALETIAARAPDWIVVLADSAGAPAPAFVRRPEWRALPAVRAGRVLALPGDLFGRPSPRAAFAVDSLRALLGIAR